ncbi:arylamine N-acetyltransferase [Streptomyces sp. NPDC056639]|uniref:arylamine N-acetyltransferase n=1 Tax=unclassified Streptomyces TaxID=2593676 RepID=UPI0036A60B58|nr:arylamine N-acetyltransferase [Streptomyces sp. CB02980]
MRKLFDVDEYLRCIGHEGEAKPDLDTLRALHKKHLMAIAYNSVSSLTRPPSRRGTGVDLVDIDEDATFDAVIAEGHGGGCIQLSRLFFRLLRELGFDVALLGGSTVEGAQLFGTEVEHMLLLVTLDDERWLVDVGYAGPSFLEPLRVGEEIQVQYGVQYRLVEDAGSLVLRRCARGGRWHVVYRFTLAVREPAAWSEFERKVNEKLRPTEPGAGGAGGVGGAGGGLLLCSRAVDDGQAVLKGRRYLTVRDGREQVRTLVDNDEYENLAAGILAGPVG